MPEIDTPEYLTVLSITDPENPALGKFFRPHWQPGPWNFCLRTERLRKGLTFPKLDSLASLNPQSSCNFEAMRSWPNRLQAIGITAVLEVDTELIFPPWLGDFVRPRARQNNHLVLVGDCRGIYHDATNTIDPLAELLSREYLQLLHQAELIALRQLPLIDQKILILRVVEELSVLKTAFALQIRQKGVRESEEKALQRLRKMRALSPFVNHNGGVQD